MGVTTVDIVEINNGNILSPKGFLAGGIHCGLRYSKKDLGMIMSITPANSAAVYTINQFQAAPIKVTKESLKASGKLMGVVVNSAYANSCTGEKGYQDALTMREVAAKKLQVAEEAIAVASTGVIGEFLPMDKVIAGIEQLKLTNLEEGAFDFQTAILTTDTVTKSCGYSCEIDSKTVHMGGAAKGSGMIHPNMGTMLAFITTDANISSEYLQLALKEVTDETFNQITVDGDTSTNDMVLVMANGLAGNEPLHPKHKEWKKFIELLFATCENLAKQIAKDGEGATKLVEVVVTGAANNQEAKQVAKQIMASNLVKTAIHGEDANWGRIISAIGQTNAQINEMEVTIKIGPITMLENGQPQTFSETEAKTYLQNDFIEIFVHLHNGKGTGKAWGCDLSYEYVKINANYRT